MVEFDERFVSTLDLFQCIFLPRIIIIVVQILVILVVINLILMMAFISLVSMIGDILVIPEVPDNRNAW